MTSANRSRSAQTRAGLRHKIKQLTKRYNRKRNNIKKNDDRVLSLNMSHISNFNDLGPEERIRLRYNHAVRLMDKERDAKIKEAINTYKRERKNRKARGEVVSDSSGSGRESSESSNGSFDTSDTTSPENSGREEHVVLDPNHSLATISDEEINALALIRQDRRTWDLRNLDIDGDVNAALKNQIRSLVEGIKSLQLEAAKNPMMDLLRSFLSAFAVPDFHPRPEFPWEHAWSVTETFEQRIWTDIFVHKSYLLNREPKGFFNITRAGFEEYKLQCEQRRDNAMLGMEAALRLYDLDYQDYPPSQKLEIQSTFRTERTKQMCKLIHLSWSKFKDYNPEGLGLWAIKNMLDQWFPVELNWIRYRTGGLHRLSWRDERMEMEACSCERCLKKAYGLDFRIPLKDRCKCSEYCLGLINEDGRQFSHIPPFTNKEKEA
ncbi:hypothetical protein ABW19_dt0203005 [Dactylella cylindrospora]|nr:hypothetical protein ABW19_dt0203005 [Dactylella cylindrospora]